jgi:hypothetical protein
MNEQSFRELYRQAVGEPPPSQGVEPLRLAPAIADRHRVPRLAALAAGTLAILVVAALVGPAALGHRAATPVNPGAVTSPATAATPAGIPDFKACKLPVTVLGSSGGPGQTSVISNEAGFVDTQTGRYTRDAGAGGEYSANLHQSLPASHSMVAPDQSSYLSEMLLPYDPYDPERLRAVMPKGSPAHVAYLEKALHDFQGTELHLVDVATGKDRLLWTFPGFIRVLSWDGNEILVEASPARGGEQTYWLINSVTGAVQSQPQRGGPEMLVLTPDEASQKGFSYSSTGSFRYEGRTHVLFITRPGSEVWIFYQTPDGGRVTIYRGTGSDWKTFVWPSGDRTGIWFGARSDGSLSLTHWDARSGLTSIPLSGLPQPPPGDNRHLEVAPAGPCI